MEGSRPALQAFLRHFNAVAWLPSAGMTVDELLALAGEAPLSRCLDTCLRRERHGTEHAWCFLDAALSAASLTSSLTVPRRPLVWRKLVPGAEEGALPAVRARSSRHGALYRLAQPVPQSLLCCCVFTVVKVAQSSVLLGTAVRDSCSADALIRTVTSSGVRHPCAGAPVPQALVHNASGEPRDLIGCHQFAELACYLLIGAGVQSIMLRAGDGGMRAVPVAIWLDYLDTA